MKRLPIDEGRNIVLPCCVVLSVTSADEDLCIEKVIVRGQGLVRQMNLNLRRRGEMENEERIGQGESRDNCIVHN